MKLSFLNLPRGQILRRYLVPLGLGLAIAGAMLWNGVRGVEDSALLWTLEASSYDMRLRASLPRRPDDRVVIIDIDEKSLAEEGHWPWSRDRLAELVDRLIDAGVRIVAFDIVFAEPDAGKDRLLLQRLLNTELARDPAFVNLARNLSQSLDRDRLFANSLRNRPVVLGYFFNSAADVKPVGKLPDNGMPFAPLREKGVVISPVANSYGANLPVLQDAAVTGGFFTTVPDPDGVLRRVPLFTLYKDQIYPSLALEAARLYLQEDFPRLLVGQIGDRFAVHSVALGDHKIPTDRFANVLVPYRGPARTLDYVSATDVLNDHAKTALLKDRIALVGTSALGLLDLRSTPVDPAYPGVEVHANIIAGMLDNSLRQEPLEKLGIDVTSVIVLGVLTSALLPLLSPLFALLFSLVLMAGYTAINLFAWQQGWVLALAVPLLTVVLILGANMAYGFLFESRGRRQLQQMFGQYVPPELVDEMANNPDSFNLDGESRLMTVLFADIRSFTTISESMTPQELKDMLNRYFTPMTRIIHGHRGTVDKYVGDMIMAFWGAPLDDPEHARHGILAALDMIRETEEMQLEFATMGYPEINIGIGLNTGPMNVGNMGSEFRMAYTVLGDSVNLGSRLEGLTKQYGARILVSEDTARGIDDIVFREVDRVVVKGQSRPITIYEPLCRVDDLDPATREELALAARAIKLYRNRDWDNAEMQFVSLLQKFPERTLYRVYIEERIKHFRANPPPADWRGEFHHTSK